jgi:leader peptidase (prepilin peptidase)/N-methyltransferase
VCDARTQRVPTPLLSIGTSVAAILVVTACAAAKDWRALAVTLVACTAAGLILALCWRFAGAGFGDVRLALAGGLGLGHTTHRGLLIAVAIFVVLTASQAAWALARTGDRRTTFALGPALAIGFLVAAAT